MPLVLCRVLTDALAAEFVLEAMRVSMNALRLAEGACCTKPGALCRACPVHPCAG